MPQACSQPGGGEIEEGAELERHDRLRIVDQVNRERRGFEGFEHLDQSPFGQR